MRLDYEQINLDGGTQPRAAIQLDVVLDYADAMREGAKFPPVVVFFDGLEYWLADGFHRVAAAMRVRPSQPIDAEIIQGTQSDAQWYSFSVNQTHGLRRTNEDKARAVKAALQHPRGASQSDRDIGLHVGVTHPTVAKYRGELAASGKIFQMRPRTVTRGDTTYRQDTTNIGTSNKRRNESRTTEHVRQTGGSNPNVHTPTRLPNPVEKMTAVSLPHNPVMGAHTLIEVFGENYLRALVEELSHYLANLTHTDPTSTTT